MPLLGVAKKQIEKLILLGQIIENHSIGIKETLKLENHGSLQETLRTHYIETSLTSADVIGTDSTHVAS